jgi:hypothetical protein
VAHPKRATPQQQIDQLTRRLDARDRQIDELREEVRRLADLITVPTIGSGKAAPRAVLEKLPSPDHATILKLLYDAPYGRLMRADLTSRADACSQPIGEKKARRLARELERLGYLHWPGRQGMRLTPGGTAYCEANFGRRHARPGSGGAG